VTDAMPPPPPPIASPPSAPAIDTAQLHKRLQMLESHLTALESIISEMKTEMTVLRKTLP
jgi:hypothetical protein